MTTKHQKVRIKIGDGFTEDERLAIAEDIMDRIYERSQDGKGIYDGRQKRFPAYTAAYKKRKGQSNVDLVLDDNMLNAMELLKHGPTTLTIGYQDGTKENAKADGNTRGTYGKQRAVKAKARPFLGVTSAELREILKKHRSDDGDE